MISMLLRLFLLLGEVVVYIQHVLGSTHYQIVLVFNDEFVN